jgi:hypothetical protein
MANGNVGFDLPMPKARGSRQAKILREEKVDVGTAVGYLEEAERGSIALTNAVREFSVTAKALLKSGLTENAVAVLMQELMPKTRRGNFAVTKETILDVLRTAARLNEHLREP